MTLQKPDPPSPRRSSWCSVSEWGRRRTEGSPPLRAKTRAAPLYSVGLNPRPDHEAIIRFGGEAPTQRAHSNERFDDNCLARVTTTSDRNRPVRQEKFHLACRNSECLCSSSAR